MVNSFFNEEDRVRVLHTARPEQEELVAKAQFAKAYVLDANGNQVGAFPSKQLKDPFTQIYGFGQGIRPPPYDLDQLASLSEIHPTHSAALEQKAADVIGSGFHLSLSEYVQSDTSDDSQRRHILRWWNSLFDEYTSTETLLAMWEDYEILGWGILEVARDTEGYVRRLYHIPAQTVRATIDGVKFVQSREGQFVWFKRWGINKDLQLKARDGSEAEPGTPREELANEVLVFKKPSRTSHWYGVPMYISSLGFITLSIAAREFNLKFFENYREPRHLIIISGLQEDVDSAMLQIRTSWQQTLRDNPHSNVALPVYGNANITVERMGTDVNDLHFTQLIELSDNEILISHRMPPDRLGAVKRGFMGGDVSLSLTQSYKDGVVSKSQLILEHRLQMFIEAEFHGGKELDYRVDLEELEVADIQMDMAMAMDAMDRNGVTINEARQWVGREALAKYQDDDGKDLTMFEWLIIAERRLEPEDEELDAAGGGLPGGGRSGGGSPSPGGGPDIGGGGGSPSPGGDAGGGAEDVETSARSRLSRIWRRRGRRELPPRRESLVSRLQSQRRQQRLDWERSETSRRLQSMDDSPSLKRNTSGESRRLLAQSLLTDE